ncbi:MAG TPA: HAMP domain-containing sensor histidine kinase, partial [Thermoanaerobaculia bacterium]|nr:HAMP domain-containing sensor histidine kinase [Thermoanaerobaculia bacterium]
WDREVVAGGTPAPGRRLAGFAAVPEFGWAVAVERERSAALAGVRRGRDLAFLLLLVLVGLAVTAGVVIGRRIARPLGALAGAVAEMSAGDFAGPAAPLPESRVTELARLSAAFRDLRGRLANRTAESARLAGELRARAEALAEADRRKDEFLAMLAHELRNPLGAIANASHVLGQGSTAPAATGRAVAVIQRQINHLVRMVDDLLDVSRITRGKVELQRERLDLAEVVGQAVESTRPAIEARRHELQVRLPAEPIVLEADRTRLEQVVSNLLRNAAKFTEPGGRIEVEVKKTAETPETPEMAEVAVRDNGSGIAPELLPRVFDLFTQGEQALDRTGAGLGIGLTLVHSLVVLHGGHVEVQSAGPGRGATFTVRLPV